jgi:type IV secretory pathway TrbD component
MLLITSPFGDNQFGGTLSTVLLVTLLGLSDRTWIIIIITMICWVIARRTEVKEKSRQRQLARSRKN